MQPFILLCWNDQKWKLLTIFMDESFQYFDWFQYFYKGPDSSWDLCIFDDFFLGGKVYIFDKEIKKIERILICINSRTFSVFVQKNTFIHAFCIKLKFILKIDFIFAT